MSNKLQFPKNKEQIKNQNTKCLKFYDLRFVWNTCNLLFVISLLEFVLLEFVWNTWNLKFVIYMKHNNLYTTIPNNGLNNKLIQLFTLVIGYMFSDYGFKSIQTLISNMMNKYRLSGAIQYRLLDTNMIRVKKYNNVLNYLIYINNIITRFHSYSKGANLDLFVKS
ncbi:MAG: hypothetical protein C4584_02455 [Armatimonadetes bacterium]|nr:MAG: hypothetical protein C4584_02455 [Armatimonadota bacterium]